ncbi:hypothetical protein TSUD_217750 [Trifolium subterraneum]|uniref:Glycosyltransferase N-terminal domain-containing protein n=1 Tax=Trifolium subterraneum TaxID=3900 RepID=A0A2Z6MVX0_TRISU|nr:hypothetical protein TSUD_217750 [Trifolium subterraneum]
MGCMDTTKKTLPHVVCIPYPAQGHINPMLKLAKLLHYKGGFHVTFVNTKFNHKRLLKARGPNSLDGLPSFRFETIPDGLPESDVDATQDIPSLFSDGVMSFTLDAAQELNIPEVLFWTTSACGFMGYMQYRHLIEKGLTPLKDLVAGENAVLPQEFLDETKNRGLLSSWCPQEEVLTHSAIGGFLTHNGWNSTLESVCGGIPMIYAKRDKIEDLVRELMDGEKGKEMKEKALQWKKLALNAASSPHGSSFVNLENLICDVLK